MPGEDHVIIGPGMTPAEIKLHFGRAAVLAATDGRKTILNFNPGTYLVDPDDIGSLRIGRFKNPDTLYISTGPGGGSIEFGPGEVRPILITFHNIFISDRPR